MKATSCIATFIGGVIVGAAATMLLTPRTGEEMRESIRDMAKKGVEKARDKYQEVSGKIEAAGARLEKLEKGKE